MPSDKITIETDVTVHVYCASCGAHLCEYSKIECSTNHIDVNVECCPECLKRQAEEYEQIIAELNQRIEELEE